MIPVLVLGVVVLLSAGVVLMVFLMIAVGNAAPAVMSPPTVLQAVLEALDLPERGLLVDLGCGDGRVLQAAAGRRKDLRVLGVENNPVPALWARWRLRGRGEVKWGNMLTLDLGAADRVFLYLSPQLMAALEPKLERELKHGARVVTMHYAFPHRRAVAEMDIPDGPAHARRLYVYEYV